MADVIRARPITHRRLLSDLCELGLPVGRHVLVHCAMTQVGRIIGGPRTLLRAIRDVIGASASVVVPTQTADNSTTSRYYQAATLGMTARERCAYEAQMPGFDPALSPSFRMGALAEHVRRHPDAVRSCHPQTSFAAVGPDAAELMSEHDLLHHLGERSPLGMMYRADAMTMLIGVDLDQCTALHLAEYRLPNPPVKTYTCFLARNGSAERCSFTAPDLDDSDFGALGVQLRAQPWVRCGRLGQAFTYVLPIRAAVDYSVDWMATHRLAVDR